MARLGAILGAILAELNRARVVSDTLTRELVNEYRGDPILASMSVPRVLLDQAELTLRFAVNEVQEVTAAAARVSVTADGWNEHVITKTLPRILDQLGVSGNARDSALKAAKRLVRIPQTAIKEALSGKPSPALRTTAQSAAKLWGMLPPDIREKLGTKAALQRELEAQLAPDLTSYLERVKEVQFTKAALLSNIDVGIRPNDLPTTMEHIQELKLTLRGEDLNTILQTTELR